MALELLLVKEGSKLGAADSLSAEALDSIKKGEFVTTSIRRPRNLRHHKKLFALLNAVFPHQNQYATTQDLLSALKIAIGYFEQGKTVDGLPFVIPKSISFASLDQNGFEAVYERTVDVILTRILPNVNRDELTDQVNEILEGNRN
jgi:hypothetical protein